MITRLKKIIQTGVFRKTLDLGKLQFKKFTVFYALNTYGKTTLKDIFSSVANDDPNLLEKRRSIPHEKVSQDIQLSFNKNGTEHSLDFTDGFWNPKDLKGKIVVFDNDFIHRNVITGFSITRENKESFTDFILGEEGVNLSEEIKLLNKELQEKKTAVVKPDYIKNIKNQKEIDAFLHLNVIEPEVDLQKLKIEIVRNIENLSNITEISNLPEVELPKVKIEEVLTKEIEKLNSELSKDYKNVTESVKEKLLSHMNKCMQGDGSKAWIKQGLKIHTKTDSCPFCGQTLANSQELIDAYNNFFNDEYEVFSNEVSENLGNIESELNKISISIHNDFLTLIKNLNKYKKYDPNINSDIEYDDISLLEDDAKEKLKLQLDEIRKIISNKNKEPHKSVSPILLKTDLLSSLHSLNTSLSENLAIKLAITGALKLKTENSSLSNEQANIKRMTYNNQLKEVDIKISRITQALSCKKYVTDLNNISILDNKILNKSAELVTQQSDYIKLYFTDLNKQFIALGSSDYTLSCSASDRGHKKVYELKISYKGKEITPENISTILSESDKRSLAFSIFITKLNHHKNQSELIIILDDPVVSFDDNRVSNTVDIFKEILSKVTQVILLTHYPSLIKKLVLSKSECVYFEIIKNSVTSEILELNVDPFVLAEHEIAFERIYSYIQRETTEDISKDCRIFMEKYLIFRFHKKIKDKKIIFNNLSELLQELLSNQLIDDSNFRKAENFRNSLNSEHHEYVFNRNGEDIRTYADSLLTFIYQL
jgi:wobble nucleotide-excising tRNase